MVVMAVSSFLAFSSVLAAAAISCVGGITLVSDRLLMAGVMDFSVSSVELTGVAPVKGIFVRDVHFVD